ncbi:hypothetical protein SDRG_06591 [Saprolegnia diclina VS20]|uniref:B box-type domain-containing protein n=1 Tax=Saprolegnia diclina (strain VS20) TaxID=1156394 RepID=T0QD64_SAPDV|nr:hypothetical protein SDRG_06591 [Saprolegnia diclina VS20]EQC35839.1 hypothetical protein SDRG_06591 [Saprolegnia diclina VS20]|eukprot:XP_008610601.1 hypothetical protein SDRG_06591 [Saprolegnia diclina VS20]
MPGYPRDRLFAMASGDETGGDDDPFAANYNWRAPDDDDDDAAVNAGLTCDECAKRAARYHCDDCHQTLCFNCTDAIHLIPALSTHAIRHVRVGDVGYVAPTRDDLPKIARRLPPPAIAKLEPHCFTFGQHVVFRDTDLGRGLLFGLALTQTRDQPRMGPCNGQFVRVLWLRGVVPLPNQCYLASLTFHGQAFWPVPISTHVSLYHAYRIAVLAEKTARKLWRREKYAGRLRRLRDQKAFPTEAVLDEILALVDTDAGGVTLQHLAHERFLAALISGTNLDGDETETETDAPYPPATRARLVLCAASCLERPADVARRYLDNVIRHMVDLYVGYAWTSWRSFVAAGRERDRQARRNATVIVLQRWVRRQWQRRREERLKQSRSSGLSALEALQRFQNKQAAVGMMDVIWAKTLRRLRRYGVATWKRCSDEIKARSPMAPIDAAWHPGLGIRLLKLPKAYASMKSDGSLGVEDIAKYKQFRLNHAGPTSVSFWIVRDRILIGEYPHGVAFPDKKRKATERVASRTDALTCILLEQIGTFVSLMAFDELRAFEAGLDPPVLPAATPDGPFGFETQLLERHAKLNAELDRAVVAAQKYATSAAKSLQQAERDPSTEDFVRDLLLKKKSAADANLNTALANKARLQPIRILRCPLPPHSATPEAELLEILNQLETCLRDGENLYIFSRQGRGRAGMVAALLLGRLYGLSAQQALERTQRCHDAQKAVAGLPSTRLVSAPESLDQIRLVHQVLSSTATIYEPVATYDGDAYLVLRRQRPGLAIQSFIAAQGFMVDEFPSAAQRAADHAALQAANRIALKEKRALQLRVRRAMEGVERQAMGLQEDYSRHELPIWTARLEMTAQEIDSRRRWQICLQHAESAGMTAEDVRIKWPQDHPPPPPNPVDPSTDAVA